MLYSFTGQNGDGAFPTAGLVIGEDGTLYGTTGYGGAAGLGTVFALKPATQTGGPWTETVLHSFRGGDGAFPYARLAMGAHGETELHVFTGPGGAAPYAGVIIGKDGALYGTTQGGGAGAGTVFQLTPPSVPGAGPWTETVLFDFASGGLESGALPQGNVVFGPNGALYGTAYAGGDTANCVPPVVGCGAVIELTPAATPNGPWTEATIHEFAGGTYDGANPVAAVVVGDGGALYGTTSIGPWWGTVFRLSPPSSSGGPWSETILHSFTGQNGDGSIPLAPVVIRDGALFGTTQAGGASGFGTVFELRP